MRVTPGLGSGGEQTPPRSRGSGPQGPELGPPSGLAAHRLDVAGEVFALLEWDAPRPTGRLEFLSTSERSVAQSLCAGLSQAEIARERGTSPRTVANQVASVYRKLGIGSRLELLAFESRARAPGA